MSEEDWEEQSSVLSAQTGADKLNVFFFFCNLKKNNCKYVSLIYVIKVLQLSVASLRSGSHIGSPGVVTMNALGLFHAVLLCAVSSCLLLGQNVCIWLKLLKLTV